MLYNTAREQTTKKNKYRLLLKKEGEITLKRKERLMEWSRVNVDLWGPKSVQNKEMSGTIKCVMM